MKQYTKAIGYITAIGFMMVVASGFFVIHDMNARLLKQQQERFQVESISKIQIFNERIENITKSFQSYAQLPSFKSIRFHSLTLNKLAVEDDRRQLELFLYDLQKTQDHLLSTRLIDNNGNELIYVDRSRIHYSLSNITQDVNLAHILELNLKPGEYHIDQENINNGSVKSLIWWLPVYVSSTQRLGYLSFKVDSTLIIKEMSDISESGLNHIVITGEHDDITMGQYQLTSAALTSSTQITNTEWVISEDLSLSGLNWQIHVVANDSIYTEGIGTTQSIINYGLIPACILIFVFFLYIYRKKLQADRHIHHLAYYDSLTGLVNRHQFDNTLNIALEETREHSTHHALLYLDLDQFKIVNDTCGHLAGDKLLEELAAHLKQSVRDSDMLARLGGDEFALLLNLCPEEKAIAIANKILSTVSDFRFIWKNKSFGVGVSIGIVFINNPEESASTILRKADLACYMAKELGRNRIHIYTDEDQSLEDRHGEMQWLSRIKQAIKDDLFYLVAQRILPLSEDIKPVQRYEILIRLKEDNNTILPDAFIPAAERYGLMTEIDRWVVEKSFEFLSKLINSPSEQNKNIIFSINISGLTLGHKDFFTFIKEQFNLYKIPPESICFEITETAAISNFSVAIDFITNIKSLGCSLALDDFGSGLCSFSYLKTIPVDYLKIDGTFITRMLDNPLDMAIVMAIKQISLATESKVIAEYVLTAEIKDKLHEIGIDYAQGYGVSQPVPLAQIFHLVDVNSPDKTVSNY